MTSQQAKNRRRGASFELDVLKWVREQAKLPAERLRLAGKNDEGDLAVTDVDVVYVVEAKAARKFDLSGWVAESQAEAVNYAKARGLGRDAVWPLVVIKRPNRPIGQSFVLTTLEDFLA